TAAPAAAEANNRHTSSNARNSGRPHRRVNIQPATAASRPFETPKHSDKPTGRPPRTFARPEATMTAPTNQRRCLQYLAVIATDSPAAGHHTAVLRCSGAHATAAKLSPKTANANSPMLNERPRWRPRDVVGCS